MATITPNYEFYLPEVNGDEAAWGQMLNANFAALDTLLGELAGLGEGVEEAPNDGQNYVRNGLDNQWNEGLSLAEIALAYLPLVLPEGVGPDFSENAGTAAAGASTTSQSLAPFEVGLWTPELWDQSWNSSEGQTYGAREGHFLRINNFLLFTGKLVMTSKGTLSAGLNAYIGGLPYVPAANYLGGGYVTNCYNMNFLVYRYGLMLTPFLDVDPARGAFIINSSVDNLTTMAAVQMSEITDTSVLGFAGIYVI